MSKYTHKGTQLNTQNNFSNRDSTLDVLRGLAAISVLLFHYTAGFEKYLNSIASLKYRLIYGNLGVELFFMISGFVIFSTISVTKNCGEFIYRRLTRVYPTFWLCMLVTFIMIKLFMPGLVKNYQLIPNATMIPLFFGCKPIDGVYWTLLYELFFYLQIALLIFFKQIGNIRFWGSVQLLLILLIKCFFSFNNRFSMMFNLQWGAFFFSGILFYQLKHKNQKNSVFQHSLIAASYIISCMSLSTLTERVIVLFFFTVFYLHSFNLMNWLSWKPLVFLGLISFPLYLLHMSIGLIIMEATELYLGHFPVLFIGLPTLVIIACAYIIHVYFEKPVMIGLRSLIAKAILRAKTIYFKCLF